MTGLNRTRIGQNLRKNGQVQIDKAARSYGHRTHRAVGLFTRVNNQKNKLLFKTNSRANVSQSVIREVMTSSI